MYGKAITGPLLELADDWVTAKLGQALELLMHSRWPP
jgi:hypothetical protein